VFKLLILTLILFLSTSAWSLSLTNSGDIAFDNDFVTVMNQEHRMKWVIKNFDKAQSIAFRADQKNIYPLPAYALETLVQFQKDTVLLKNLYLSKYRKYEQIEFDIGKGTFKEYKHKIFQFYTLALIYELFYSTQEVFDKNRRLRRHLNRSNQEFSLPKDTFTKWSYFIKGVKTYERLAEGAVLFETFAPTKNNLYPMGKQGKASNITRLYLDDPQMKYIKNQIAKLTNYQKEKANFLKAKNGSFFERARIDIKRRLGKTKHWLSRLSDGFAEFRYELQNKIFQWGGTTIAQIQSEPGKLLNNQVVIKSLKSQLKAGDIIWDQTRSKFSGASLTPGFWDHNAVWLGTEKELKELGVFKYLAPKYQKAIREGKSVAEALHNGVVLNNLDHFLNIDDLLVARIKGFYDTTPEAKKLRFSFFTKTFRLIGLQYDFTIDSQRIERIVCSSLIQRLLSEEDYYGTRGKKQYVPLYLYKLLNTHQALPDSTFYKLVEPKPILEPVALYLDGKMIGKGQEDRVKMTSILRDMFFDFWSVDSQGKKLISKDQELAKKKWKIEGPKFKDLLNEIFNKHRIRSKDYLIGQ
jgi:hypothetical protein